MGSLNETIVAKYPSEMQKSEYLLISILACLFDLIEAKSGGGGFLILTGFGVWGTVITIISILCCIGCCLIPLCNSKEEKQGRVLNENPQLQQVVTSKQEVPFKWDGRAWVPASRAEVQSSQIQRSIQQDHKSGGHSSGVYNGGYNESGGYKFTFQ